MSDAEPKKRGVKAGSKRKPYVTRRRLTKIPTIGTIEWQLLRLQVGETYSLARFLSMEEATPEKLQRLKNSMRAQFGGLFKGLRSEEYKRDFSLSVYDFFDNNKKLFVVIAVTTSVQWFPKADKTMDSTGDAEQQDDDSAEQNQKVEGELDEL